MRQEGDRCSIELDSLAWERMVVYLHEDEMRSVMRDNEALKRFEAQIVDDLLVVPDEAEPTGTQNGNGTKLQFENMG
jgi:hypothetical protein